MTHQLQQRERLRYEPEEVGKCTHNARMIKEAAI
jgi:hypothetical protein